MDEIGNSGTYQPSSSVMESPLMQLANASVSVMRANLSPKEMKNSVESKINPSHSTSSNVNTDPHISLLSNSSIDSFTKTHVPLEGTVLSTSNPLPDKIIKKSGNTSFILVGTKNPVLDNISTSQISKHGNICTQVTGVNSEFITQESDSHKEPTRCLLPLDSTIVNVTKSVGMILTSKPSESMFTTSNMVSTLASEDTISKRTDNPKEQTLSLPTLPNQINTTNSQTENVPVKSFTPKLTTCKNEKNISLLPSESIPKTKYTAVQNLQSVPLKQKDAKAFANPNSVTEESHKNTNCSPQIKQVSNAGVTPISTMCSLPSKTPLILPVTASSTLTEIELHSIPLLPSHTIAQTSTTHSILNKHSYLKESQNISENVKFTSEIIPNNILVNVPTLHTSSSSSSSVKMVPNSSQMPFPAKSADYISPSTIAVGSDISGKKPNQSSSQFSSVNLVSKMSSPISKQLNKSDKKDIVRVVQGKAGVVEISSKRSSAKVIYCSSGEVNTLDASNSSIADTNFISVCTVDSTVAFSTPALNTIASDIASTTKCNPDNVTHTLLTSTTSCTTFSTSVASYTHSVSTCPPIICSHMVTGSLTTASSITLPSTALCLSSLSTDTLPSTYTSVSSTNLPLTTPCSTSTSMHKSDIATSTHNTTCITTNTTSITSIQSSKKLTPLHEYEIMSNKSDVNNSKNVSKKPPITCFQDQNLPTNVTKSHSVMSHFIGGQSSGVQNTNKQNQYSLTTAIMEPLPSIAPKSEIDSKTQDVSEDSSSIAMTKEPPASIIGTEAPASITGTEAPTSIVRMEVLTSIVGTEVQTSIVGTKAPSTIDGTKAPSTIDGTKAPSTIDGTEAPSTVDGTEVPSSNLNQLVSLAPDESFVTVINPPSDKKVSGCKSPSDQLSKNVLTRIEANMDSSAKPGSSTRITETSDSMTTVSSSPDKSVPFSSQQSSSVSMLGTAGSVVGDIRKKNLTNKNTSSSVRSVNSDKSELVPLRKKLPKKSKSPGKESKSNTLSKTCVSSNSALSSVTSKEEPVGSDLHNLSTSYPKFTNVLKDNSTISSNEKKKSPISTVNPANSTKASAPTKTEGCNISTRPRRTIKTRHLFSSSSYSTGSIKSDAAGENSSSNKQRKRTITQSTDEEKKSTSSNNNTKKSHINKTATDEETCSPLKKTVRRRILPAVKSDSADTSKNCLLIKTSNVAQVPSDTSLSPGYTYLLTALSLTSAEKDSGKIVKTPTMASNSGVTSTSPTYSSSKRNVTTKCSTTKEEKSSERTIGQTEKTCSDSLISSPRTSISHKSSWNISPVNSTDNTSDESLEGANESDTLQNSTEISLSRKRKNSTSDVSAASNSLSPKSCEDLSQQIAEAEKFIKKEPIEATEVDQTVVENNAEATSQNSCVVSAPSRETCEIRKLLNAGCSNTQTSLVQDLINPNSGNNFSQTRPLAPVQLSSPYAIFLPVSLASGATTTVTAPSTSTPLYSIQLNVPNVVRMGKPFLPNDGSITKKQCTTIPAITSPKTDNSCMKSNLISRNNLIATYYPAPLPESLMNKITVNYHACGECGDTFLFKSSLNAHKSRKCMQLTYNCDNCTMKLVFYNKCSVLEHIRSHYPTRPVTIKLDRMEVMPLPEGITDVLEMEDRSKEENSVRDSEDAAKFDCTECGAKFHSARPLADHFGHSEIFCSFTFYCALCQTYLPRHCAQLAHRRVHHEKPPHVCPECGQLIPNLFSFREHLKYKCMHFSRIAPLTCPKCMSKFCYTPELKEHIISVHSETFIKCSICPMAFKASTSYQTHHQNTHASEVEQKKEIYKCPLCDTVFHSIQQLMNHVDFHIGELKIGINYAFRCSICFSIFAKRSQLVSHLGSSHHLDYVQHRCEFCDCVCKTAHNLQTHQRAIHKVELKKFELSKGSKMKGESAAAKSKKMKNGDVTHCSLCHIFFATLAQLQMHTMKVHQKKMNDSLPDSGTVSEQTSAPVPKNKNSQKFCRYCKAPYKSWSRLMQHILGHRNSGVYICLICTCAAFISKEELSKHEEFCSGENLHSKPPAVYECEECHQLFKQESWLIAHQKNIHPKKGALTCDLSAGLSNKSNSSLPKNIQVAHESKKSFCCYVCKELNKEKIFRCQSQLEKHLMTKHKMSLKQMKMKQSAVEEKNNKNSSGLPQEEPSDKNKQAALKSVDLVPAKKAKLATPKEETYICAKCNFTSQNFYIFQLHIQEHKTSDDGFQCTTCGLCFAVVDSLRMHLFAVHKIKRSNDSLRDEGISKSPVCKVIEETNSSPVAQSPVTNTPLTVTAPESTTTVASEPKAVVEPVKITSDNNSDSNLLTCQCNVCYKMFETEHLLKVHMRTHGMAFIRSKRLTMSE